MTRSGLVILLLVMLRLATGWHFYNEGVKKLDPGFSSAGFLRNAKGPLAPMFRDKVTGPHDLTTFFAVAQRFDDEGASESVDEAITAWIDRMSSDWDKGLARIGRLGASDEQLDAASALKAQSLADLDAYFRGQKLAISELRHELSRLAQLRSSTDKGSPPYLAERIAKKEAETWGAMQPWFRATREADRLLASGVSRIVGGDVSPNRVKSALADRSTSKQIDNAVTVVVLGSGVLLFLGLFTPLAAVAAAGFLISVMATQPPWVAGADTTYFFYQLVEVLALVILAVVGAGRWAGLDRLVFGRPRIALTGQVSEDS